MLYTDADIEASMDKIETLNFHQVCFTGGTMYILIRFCMFYAYTRPRYQVSIYRTIGPLFLLYCCYI